MDKNFKYINTIKKNVDLYIFVICGNFKKNIENIKKTLKIEKLPKKLLEDINLNTNFEKMLYIDNYEILLHGLSNNHKCNNENLYHVFGNIGKSISNKNKNVLVQLVGDDEIIIKNQIISYILGFYHFTNFKSDIFINNNVSYFYTPKKKLKNIINNSIYEAIIQNEIRSLINTPANILTSTTYSKYIKKNITENIKVKILTENDLKKIGCNLILGVNQGSKNKAMMVLLEYKNNPIPNKTIALVGKGVMFDSGGYSIKHGDFSDMKNDMAGSAVVYGVLKLLSKFNVRGHFIGLLPLVENMVDSNSIRPGDILTAYNGKTVEIVDTDAEGRLIMADALAYSSKYKPYMCIDIATLTGQAVAIFDSKSSVIMGNNNKYIRKMIEAGIQNNEKIWELPMWKEYVDLTKSNIADFKNHTYEAKAGTIMAGAFLSNFVPEKVNWLHLDIAGVDNLKSDTHMRHYGASGEILRSVFYFIQNINKYNYEK